MEANVYALEGQISLGPNGTYAGSYLARVVEVKGGSVVSLESAFGLSP